MSLWGFFCVRDVRKCPKCKVRIQKNGGCPHMNCQRCHFDFCWCCMSEYRSHNKCYALCPALPFSIFVNIILVILGMALSPAIFTLGPIAAAFYWWCVLVDWGYRNLKCMRRSGRGCGCSCCFDMIVWLLLVTCIVLPFFLALAGLAAGLAIGLLTLPTIYYGIAYIVRVIFNVITQ